MARASFFPSQILFLVPASLIGVWASFPSSSLEKVHVLLLVHQDRALSATSSRLRLLRVVVPFTSKEAHLTVCDSQLVLGDDALTFGSHAIACNTDLSLRVAIQVNGLEFAGCELLGGAGIRSLHHPIVIGHVSF